MSTENILHPFPKKSLGQNFLIHQPAIETIADIACRDAADVVIELGTGTGNLTLALAERCRRVISLEIDERLLSWHEYNRRLPGNVDLRRGDMLKLSYEALYNETGEKLRIAGNLPYNISTQVVFEICRHSRFIKEAWLLFQKEVAERIVSPPGSKSYGILSVAARYSARAGKVLDLPPAMFRPRPKIHSSLVHFKFRESIEPTADDYDFFLKTIKASFSQRRKKIVNCLASFFRKKRPEMAIIMEAAGISPDLRAERLDVEQFVTLSNVLRQSVGRGAKSS